MAKRLRRLDEVWIESPIYFVTMCTEQRRRLLANDDAHRVFRAFGEAGVRTGCAMGNYVLMPDHLHLFVAVAPGNGSRGLSNWGKALKALLARHWSERGIEGPYWQKSFFDHVIRSSDSMTAKWLYVRENPVRAGLVADADAWPYAGCIVPIGFSG